MMPEEIFVKIDKVTFSDILRVAKDIFREKTLNLAVVGPHKNGKKLEKILDHSRKIYEESMHSMVYLDYQSIGQLFNWTILKSLFSFGMFKSFHKYIASVLENKHLQKILEFTTVFLGGSPYNTPAFYTLIAHTDFNLGIWYPLGGIHSFILGLKKLCEEQGVKIITGEEVKKIISSITNERNKL